MKRPLAALALLVPLVAQAGSEPAPEAPKRDASPDAPANATPAEVPKLDASPSAAPAEAPKLDASPTVIDNEQQKEIEALKAEVDALKSQVALSQAPQKTPKKQELEFELDGYYRVRGYIFNHLFASQGTGDDYRDARYLQQRLRLQPIVRYGDAAMFAMQVDALDDVVFGDNESMASTALFAGDPSNTTLSGFTQPGVQVSRAWMELKLPVGVIRAGRMPSQWGMGLLANGGDGFDDTFGENHDGATYDRLLFATRPIAFVQKAMKKDDTEIPLYAAVGVDRLVEDPLFQYYGYKCKEGEAVDADTNAACDTDGDGVQDVTHDYVDDTRTDAQRTPDWWAEQNDDVMETVYVLVYKGDKVRYFGEPGSLSAGVYVVNRTQRETDSKVLISDAYLSAVSHGVHLEFEGLHIGGQTNAIALPGAVNVGADNPLHKTADINGYVIRGGYGVEDRWLAMMEHGYASGDDNVADEDFTGRPLHPDFNVGLLLYEEIIARVTAHQWQDASGLWSNGGVYNSRYIFPNVHFYAMDHVELEAAYLEAWPDRPDGAIIRCVPGEDCAQTDATSKPLGQEIDAAVKVHWADDHLLWSLEGGYAHATDRLPLEQAGLNPNGKFFTVQSRLAYVF